MKKFIMILASFVALPTIGAFADELGAINSVRAAARASAVNEARNATRHLQHEVQKVTMTPAVPAPKPISIAKLTVPTTAIVTPQIIRQIETHPIVTAQKLVVTDTTRNVLIIKNDLRNTKDAVKRTELNKKLMTEEAKLRTQKEDFPKTLINESKKEARKVPPKHRPTR